MDGNPGRSWIGSALAVLATAVASSACGGKLLIESQAGVDAGSTDDAGLATSWADGASGFAASSASGGSSGSSGGSIAPIGTSGASSGAASGAPSCGSASDCASGLVCCATHNFVTGCEPPPCPAAAPFQFCATSLECVEAHATCSRLMSEPEDTYMVCQ